MLNYIIESSGFTRIIILIVFATSVHLLIRIIRKIGKKLVDIQRRSPLSKVNTLISLIMSALIFLIYFLAFGFILKEFKISLKAYLASASIIGLAVGFGFQGFVQDIVTGLTIVLSNLFDIGDMVEISGQTGIIKEFGIRFTVMTNYLGADIYIPNRMITNVINYPRGYVRGIAEIQLLRNNDLPDEIERIVEQIAKAAYERFAGICILEPSVESKYRTVLGNEYLRIKFRIWPGQGAPLENYFKREVIESIKKINENFEDWMVTFNYEVEKKSEDS